MLGRKLEDKNHECWSNAVQETTKGMQQNMEKCKFSFDLNIL